MTPLLATLSWLRGAPKFIADYGVFLEGSISAAVIAAALYYRPRAAAIRWVLGASIAFAVSLLLALIATTVYYLPPVQHSGPITPGTANSFPSHHALLAWLLVVGVALIRPFWAIGLGVVAVLIDVSLVVSHDHWPQDVIASTAIVAIGAAVAYLLLPALDRWLAPALASMSEAIVPEDQDALSLTVLQREIATLERENMKLQREMERLRAAVEGRENRCS